MKLLGRNNAKTVKGEKYGWTTFILYMAPYKSNSHGKNLCPNASQGCIKSCLFSAGHGSLKSVSEARIRRADFFIENQRAFMLGLFSEISEIAGQKHENQIAIRLNGTTDIPFENIEVMDGKNIFELFPEIQFYDYTKSVKRMLKEMPKNYSLTFSRSETNDKTSEDLLKMGKNVAYVFNKIPTNFKGFEVVDGDKHDLRFSEATTGGRIIGLKYKNIISKGADNKSAFESGFAIRIGTAA